MKMDIKRNSPVFLSGLNPQLEFANELSKSSLSEIGKIIEQIINHFSLHDLTPIVIKATRENKQYLSLIRKRLLYESVPLMKDGSLAIDWNNGDEISILFDFQKIIDDRKRTPEEQLIDILPNTKTYKSLRGIAIVLVTKFNKPVDNFFLVKCMKIKQLNNKYRLSKKDYLSGKNRYNNKLENKLKTLRRLWKNKEYSIKFSKNSSTLIKL